MAECIFCKIVSGDVPCVKLFEDDDFLAFLDIAPVTEGHTLIIPKQHVENFSDFPSELGEQWFRFSKKVVSTLKVGLGITDFNVGMNSGKFAGQVVFHQHTHFIPRREGDGLEHWPGKKAAPEELKSVKERILKK